MTAGQTLLGISMASQRNRRSLVAVTYTFFTVCVAAILTLGLEKQTRWLIEAWSLLLFVAVVAGWGVFIRIGSPVVDNPFPGWARPHWTGPGLVPNPLDPKEPDERQLIIQNTAYRKAFRAMALYAYFATVFVFALLPFSVPLIPLFMLLGAPILVMVFTLPQAIILWTEPDVPEEASV